MSEVVCAFHMPMMPEAGPLAVDGAADANSKKAKAVAFDLVRLTTPNRKACRWAMTDVLAADSAAPTGANPFDMEVVAQP
jgi:hypothetical protein